MVGGGLPEPKFICYYVLYKKWCRGVPNKIKIKKRDARVQNRQKAEHV